MRRRLLVVILGVALALAAWATVRVVDSRLYRAALEQAKASIAAGSPVLARRLLAESAARWPREGELTYLLGACELALGRPDAAEAAWSRVPTDSPFAGHAAMLRVRQLMKRDRFAAAEELLPAALMASGQHAIEAREALVLLFKLEGRFAEVRSLVEKGWDSYPDRFGLLRQLANLDSINPVPIEHIRPALEKAAEVSPDDDRIWLGRANLAIRTGEFAKAKHWLDDCVQRRPHDDAIWQSRLDLALATGDVAGRARHLGISRPTVSRLSRSSPYAPGSPPNLATKSRERQALEKLLERGAWQGAGRGAAGRARTASRAYRQRCPAARAEGRAGSGQDPLRDARDETQCGGRPALGRDGAAGGGAGPDVRGPVPLVCGSGALAR